MLAVDSDARAAQWRQRSVQLHREGRQWLEPARLAALDATEANVDALGQRVRTLHEQAGGLRLR